MMIPEISIPIPFPTFPTYIWPIPSKPNIPPINAMSAAVPGLLYGSWSTIDVLDAVYVVWRRSIPHLGHFLISWS